jgi:hypothetical protein
VTTKRAFDVVRGLLTVSVSIGVGYTVNEVRNEYFVDKTERHYHLAVAVTPEKGDRTKVYVEGDSLVIESKGKRTVFWWPLPVDEK